MQTGMCAKAALIRLKAQLWSRQRRQNPWSFRAGSMSVALYYFIYRLQKLCPAKGFSENPDFGRRNLFRDKLFGLFESRNKQDICIGHHPLNLFVRLKATHLGHSYVKDNNSKLFLVVFSLS